LNVGHEEPIPEIVRSQLQNPDKVVVRPADLRISFEQFMDLLYSPNFNASFYLEYCSITSSLPTMLEDIETFNWANFFTVEMTNIWLGNGKTVGKLHFGR
jgi:jumonji domain-containing protein 7